MCCGRKGGNRPGRSRLIRKKQIELRRANNVRLQGQKRPGIEEAKNQDGTEKTNQEKD